MVFRAAAWAVLLILSSGFSAEEFGQPTRLSLGDAGFPGVQGTFSAASLQPGEFALAFGGQGHTQASWLSVTPLGGPPSSPDEALIMAFRASLAIGLGHGVDGSIALPYYYESLSGDALDFNRSRGPGDLVLTLKGVLPWKVPWFSAAALMKGTLPVAGGEGTFPRELIHHPPEGGFPSPSTWPFGTVDPRLAIGFAGTLLFESTPLGTVLMHGNFLGERPVTPSGMDALGLIRSSAAMEAPLGPWVRFTLEAERQEIVIEPLDWSADIGEGLAITLGLAYAPAPWIAARAWGRFGPEAANPEVRFTRDGAVWTYRVNPPFQAGLALSLQGFPLRWDQDRDGHPDRMDRCPRRAEDKDGFEDGDGCPDIDNDRDGIVDSLDRCPIAPEDRDGFKDWDGCPDADNDMDGVEDSKDACGNEAEDRDGVQDDDGCPDLDDDRDGIPDAADRCPKAAENRNGFEDNDGCPEPDQDRDGMPDKLDRCPTEAELVNFYQDEDGCPDVKPEPVRSGVLPGVIFLSGNAELIPASYPSLDSLARLLAIYPGTEIEIQGHLDDRSGQGALELSHDRAKAVATYLEMKGIEARRLKPSGYGATRPIGSNRTAKGREANRRIEIRRLN